MSQIKMTSHARSEVTIVEMNWVKIRRISIVGGIILGMSGLYTRTEGYYEYHSRHFIYIFHDNVNQKNTYLS